MFWILLTFFLIVLLVLSMGYFFSAPTYKGPESDHFNGSQFTNIGNVKAKGFASVLKWAAKREKNTWRELNDLGYGEPPMSKVGYGELVVTFINHSTFLIQIDNVNILTDPVWSDYTSPVQWLGPKRMRSPGIRLEDLPKIDFVIISHNHYDHLDVNTMRKVIERHNPKIFSPLGVGKFIKSFGAKNVQDMDWWDEEALIKDLSLASVPAQHFSGRGIFDRDRTLWCGYVIKSQYGNVYFAGDSGYEDFFKDIGRRFAPIRLGMLPIGAYKPNWFMSPIHTSPEEAVKIHLEIQAVQSIGTHFGTFPLADDGKQDPVDDLELAKAKLNIPDDDFWIPKEGKARRVMPLSCL